MEINWQDNKRIAITQENTVDENNIIIIDPVVPRRRRRRRHVFLPRPEYDDAQPRRAHDRPNTRKNERNVFRS